MPAIIIDTHMHLASPDMLKYPALRDQPSAERSRAFSWFGGSAGNPLDGTPLFSPPTTHPPAYSCMLQVRSCSWFSHGCLLQWDGTRSPRAASVDALRERMHSTTRYAIGRSA